MQDPQSWTATYDYASVIITDEAALKSLYLWAEGATEQMFQAGHNLRPFSAHGFSGHRLGDLGIATNGPSHWVTVSGYFAETEAPILFRVADHATRVDLAVTAEFNPRVEELASREYYRFEAQDPEATTKKHSLILSENGGQTFYIGSRKSSRFGRLYDRGARAGTHIPGQCWRWEVEYKGDKADQIRTDLTRLDHASTIKAGLVTDFFQGRGIAIPALVGPVSMVEHGSTHAKSLYNTLEWYAQQVAPSVKRLIDSGLEQEALKALGFRGE